MKTQGSGSYRFFGFMTSQGLGLKMFPGVMFPSGPRSSIFFGVLTLFFSGLINGVGVWWKRGLPRDPSFFWKIGVKHKIQGWTWIVLSKERLKILPIECLYFFRIINVLLAFAQWKIKDFLELKKSQQFVFESPILVRGWINGYEVNKVEKL